MGFPKSIALMLVFLVVGKCETFPECDSVEQKSFISHPEDCESYIYCDGDQSFEAKCEQNLRFNANEGICDDPQNVECNSETKTIAPVTKVTSTTLLTSTSRTSVKTSKPPVSSTSTVLSSTPTVSIGSSTSPATFSTTKPNSKVICPPTVDPEEIVYLPNTNSCSEYFMCHLGTAIPLTCPSYLEFSSLTGSCKQPEEAYCEINIGTTTKSPKTLCTRQTSGLFPYTSNCHYYYRCMKGILTIQECPLGFGWDKLKKMCTSTACKN